MAGHFCPTQITVLHRALNILTTREGEVGRERERGREGERESDRL